MPATEYACVFVRPPPERLLAAERLVRGVPGYLGGAEGECDLHRCAPSGYLAALFRAASTAFSKDALARLSFWSARLGARGFVVGSLPEPSLQRFRAELALCEKVVREIPFSWICEGAARFFREIGAGCPPTAAGARPVLAVDLDGPGSEGLSFRRDGLALFVAGVLAPPRGDELALSVRRRGADRPVEGRATVVEVRGRDEAAPGRPAGFTLRIDGPSALHDLLAARAADRQQNENRAAPRFAVSAPVKVKPAAAPPPPPPPHARIEYATEQQLAADWVENLSHGGAFIRTERPVAEGTALVLELALPDGAKLEAQAVVVFRRPLGMGVRFVLGPEEDAILSAAMARISARARRALVVDDDALARRMLGDALNARGFEIVTAVDGDDAIRRLAEELLTLDLLVTDVCMPGHDGEELVGFIRRAGGESDLTIVAVSGRIDADMEEKLARAGADAVLDKALGPELLAQAADAALERRRLVQQADAA